MFKAACLDVSQFLKFETDKLSQRSQGCNRVIGYYYGDENPSLRLLTFRSKVDLCWMIILFTSSSEHQLTLFTKTDIPDLQTDVHITDLETRLPTG